MEIYIIVVIFAAIQGLVFRYGPRLMPKRFGNLEKLSNAELLEILEKVREIRSRK